MKKTKVFTNVLLAIALIAASAVTVHAGAGAGGDLPADLVLFDCYFVERAADSPYVLDLTDQFGTRTNVRVGSSRLLCAPTTAAVHIVKGPVLNPDYTNALDSGVFPDHINCYDAWAPRDFGGPSGHVKIIDPLGTQTVGLNRLVALCAPAFKEPLP